MDRRTLRSLLAGRGLAPRKRFGQHFLLDPRINRSMVEAAGVVAGDVALEVGPGTGALTEELLAAGAHVLAVEIDRGLVEVLRERLGGEERLHILCRDVLAGKHRVADEVVGRLADLVRSRGTPGFRWVSNLPYNVATPLIAETLALPSPRLLAAALTVQSEVAERLAAEPGSRDYGPITVQLAVRSDVAVLRRIPAAAFWPSPAVESAAILLRPKAGVEIPDSFQRFIASLFSHRRKTLGGCLLRTTKARVGTRVLAELGLRQTDRVEDLSPDKLLELHRRLQSGEAGDGTAKS